MPAVNAKFYCLHCRKQQSGKNIKERLSKNKRALLSAECSECSKKMTTFKKSEVKAIVADVAVKQKSKAQSKASSKVSSKASSKSQSKASSPKKVEEVKKVEEISSSKQ